MKNKAAIYRVLIVETVLMVICTAMIGSLSAWLMNLLLHEGYALNSLSFIVIVNLLILILQKGLVEKELTSFIYSRKLLLSINICSDIAVALAEAILLGGISYIAIANPALNERLRLLDMEKVIDMATAGHYFLMLFGIALLTQAMLTVDMMGNHSLFQGFFAHTNNKKQSVISFVVYIATAVVMGIGSSAYMDIKEPILRYCMFGAMILISLILYVIAYKLSRKKQYTT